jgi:hypothetical protein
MATPIVPIATPMPIATPIAALAESLINTTP